MDIRISFRELYRGKIPSYESGDTITIFAEGNVVVPDYDELRVIFSHFSKPYHLMLENIQPRFPFKRGAIDDSSPFGDKILLFCSPDLNIVGCSLFRDCTELTEIFVPSVIAICNYAMSGCKKLEKVYVPKLKYYVGSNAFAECESLREFIMPC